MPVITASKDDGIGITGDWMRQSISQAKPASHRLVWAGGQEQIWERSFTQTATLGGRCDGAPNTIRTCGLSLRRGMLYPAELPGQAQERRIIACCSIDRIQCHIAWTKCGSRRFKAGRTITPILARG